MYWSNFDDESTFPTPILAKRVIDRQIRMRKVLKSPFKNTQKVTKFCSRTNLIWIYLGTGYHLVITLSNMVTIRRAKTGFKTSIFSRPSETF
jgi:hypothetical protein